MALQRINWTQIETETVAPGTTVDLGSSNTPLNAVYTDNLYVSGTSLSEIVSGAGGGMSGSSGTSGTSGTSGQNGSSGTSGARGSSGTSGTSGTSSDGSSGSSGTSGQNGTNGTNGSSGTSGQNGSSGTSGSNGSSGSSGTSGARGSSGTSGTSGSSGQNGSNGSSGTSGATGATGSSGTSGTSGQNGTSGTSGSSGQNGLNGTNGSSGSSGSSGTSGISGNHGTSGSSGTSGARGTSGTSGTSGNIYKTSSTTNVIDIDEYVGLEIPFIVDSGLSYTTGQVAIAASNVDNYLIGRVVSYIGTTLTLKIIDFSGGSNHEDWAINLYSAVGGEGSGGSSTLTVTDGSTTVTGVDRITFDGATISNDGSGDVTVTIVGGSGGGGTNGTSGSNGSSGTSGTSGIAGSGGTSGTSGSSGTSGTSGSSGATGATGTSGTSGSSGTSPVGASGFAQMYQIILNTSGGNIDTAGTPIQSVLGPNGENKATLESAGWNFSFPTNARISISRPVSKQVQPLVNIMVHGVNDSNVISIPPVGRGTIPQAGTVSSIQTFSTPNFTTLDLYGLTYQGAFFKSSGQSTCIITFGLIS